MWTVIYVFFFMIEKVVNTLEPNKIDKMSKSQDITKTSQAEIGEIVSILMGEGLNLRMDQDAIVALAKDLSKYGF